MSETVSSICSVTPLANLPVSPGVGRLGPDELLWFVHLHKCAGTFVVKHAAQADLSCSNKHRNGNPLHADGSYVDFGQMSNHELNRYLDHCLEAGIRFVASEFSYPRFDTLLSHPQVRVMTVIRDPFQRYVSNYLYDIGCGFTNARNIRSYQASAGGWTYFNYYMNVFTRTESPREQFTDEEYQNAIQTLSRFDLLLSQDQPDFGERLAAFFGNAPITKRSNATKGLNWKMLLGRARRGNLLPLINSLMASKTIPDGFEAEFQQHNTRDIRLFQKAHIGHQSAKIQP